MDRSDSEFLGRDDPGSIFPEKIEFITNVDDGAESQGRSAHCGCAVRGAASTAQIGPGRRGRRTLRLGATGHRLRSVSPLLFARCVAIGESGFASSHIFIYSELNRHGISRKRENAESIR